MFYVSVHRYRNDMYLAYVEEYCLAFNSWQEAIDFAGNYKAKLSDPLSTSYIMNPEAQRHSWARFESTILPKKYRDTPDENGKFWAKPTDCFGNFME